MIITMNITRIWIDDITRIEATEPKDIEHEMVYQRKLIISDKSGNRYDIILEAEMEEKLKFLNEEESCLTPRPYKGSKAFRREKEE